MQKFDPNITKFVNQRFASISKGSKPTLIPLAICFKNGLYIFPITFANCNQVFKSTNFRRFICLFNIYAVKAIN